MIGQPPSMTNSPMKPNLIEKHLEALRSLDLRTPSTSAAIRKAQGTCSGEEAGGAARGCAWCSVDLDLIGGYRELIYDNRIVSLHEARDAGPHCDTVRSIELCLLTVLLVLRCDL